MLVETIKCMETVNGYYIEHVLLYNNMKVETEPTSNIHSHKYSHVNIVQCIYMFLNER